MKSSAGTANKTAADGFVSFRDLRLELSERVSVDKDIAGANLLAAGSGMDASAKLFSPSLRYALDAEIETAPPRKAGWLFKEGHGMIAGEALLANLFGCSWQRRFFVLSNGFLEYFELPEYSPVPWGTHGDIAGQQTATRASTSSPSFATVVHVTNVKGHIDLSGVHISDPKSVRRDASGEARAAWRIDCAPEAASAYNKTYRGNVLVPYDINQLALAAHANETLSPSALMPALLWQKGSSKESLAPDAAGTAVQGRRNSMSASAVASSLASACVVPGMHLKYVLAAETESEATEWREVAGGGGRTRYT